MGQRLAESHNTAENLEKELDRERKKALALERELAKKTAESLLSQAEKVKGINVLAVKVPSARIEILREMSDIIRDNRSPSPPSRRTTREASGSSIPNPIPVWRRVIS